MSERSGTQPNLTIDPKAAQKLLLTQFPAVTWTADARLRLTAWAGRALLDLGYSETDFLGMPLDEFYAKGSNPKGAVAAHERALAGKAAEFKVTWAGRDFHAHVEPLLSEAGSVIGCIGFALDVTERNQEAAKVAKAARFRMALTTLVEASLRGDLGTDLHQRVIEVTISVVPGAQTGAIWLRGDDGLYRAAAAVGFDRDALSDVAFTERELRDTPTSSQEIAVWLERMRTVDPARLTALRAAGPFDAIRSVVSLTAEAAGKTLAFLHLHNLERDNAFTAEEVQMARAFAGNVAMLLQRAELERDLRSGNDRLGRLLNDYKSLAEFSSEIETIHDTDQLIERGLERVLATLGFDTAFFSEVRDGGVHFTRVRGVSTPELEATLATPIPLGAGINGRVALSGEAMFVQDYRAWSERHRAYVASGVESMLALPIKIDGRVRHTIAFGTIGRQAPIDANAERIAKGFVARLENAFERVQYLEEIEATRDATFRALGLALEYRDLETRGHTDRVVDLTLRFADELELGSHTKQALAWGAYLHDIGKIAVPDLILLKPGKLTEEEFAIIRQHTLYGAEMTRDIAFLPTETRQVIRNHHERWDGCGYPDNLAGNEIPLLARMFSLVDVYDALTNDRPYKRAWTHEEAAAEIQAQAGLQFDAELVQAFLDVLARPT